MLRASVLCFSVSENPPHGEVCLTSANDRSVHTGHRARMRRRFDETGLTGFQPHEMLELILMSVIPKKDVNPLAHALIDRFGSIYGALSASDEELHAISGVGPRTCTLFDTLTDVLHYYGKNRLAGRRTINDVEQAVEYFRYYAHRGYTQETIVLLEDNRGQMLSGRVFPYNLHDPMVIRDVLRAALSVQAHSVIIALQGYGPLRKPTRSDLDGMRSLVAALYAVNIYTVELLIMSGDHVYSLREVDLLTDSGSGNSGSMPRWSHWLAPLQKYPGTNNWHYIPSPPAEPPPRF